MKFYLSLTLSALIHVAAAFLINSPATSAQAPKQQTALLVSIKSDIRKAATSKSSIKLQNKTAVQNNPFTDYLSEQEVEMKALPKNNIDETKLEGVFISGLPIKMRLYIDSEGRLVKIDSAQALEQDHALRKKLEQLLQDLAFLPAKKNGVSVNSYQDIAFSFN
jgi:hypothetical protein